MRYLAQNKIRKAFITPDCPRVNHTTRSVTSQSLLSGRPVLEHRQEFEGTSFPFLSEGKAEEQETYLGSPRQSVVKAGKENRPSHEVTCRGPPCSGQRAPQQVRLGWLMQSAPPAACGPQGLPGMLQESVCTLAY